MNKLLVLIPALMLAGCALTPEQLRIAYHATNAVDVGATIDGLHNGCREANPFMGSNPSSGKVIAFGALASLIYEGIYWHLEDAPLSERLAFGRMFLIVKGLGPVVTASQGCL